MTSNRICLESVDKFAGTRLFIPSGTSWHLNYKKSCVISTAQKYFHWVPQIPFRDGTKNDKLIYLQIMITKWSSLSRLNSWLDTFFVMHYQDEILVLQSFKANDKMNYKLKGGKYNFTIQSPPHFLPIPYDWVKDIYIKMVHNNPKWRIILYDFLENSSRWYTFYIRCWTCIFSPSFFLID